MKNEKFLLVSYHEFVPGSAGMATHDGEGFDHESRHLRWYLEIAAMLGRTAVVENMPLTLRHNRYCPPQKDPRIYYDLDNVYYHYPSKAGETGAVHKLSCVVKEGFPIEEFSSQDILVIDSSKRECIEIPKHNHYPLIALTRIGAAPWRRPKAIHPSPPENPIIALHASRKVLELAQKTVRQMFGGSQHTKAIKLDPDTTNVAPSPMQLPYVVVHARRGDKLRKRSNIPPLLSTTVDSIIGNLKRHKDITPQTPIYFMTNEERRLRRYIRKLKRHFPNLYTYQDFEHLTALLTKKSAEDWGDFNNYLLYAVEKLILRNAHIQFITHLPAVAAPHQIQLRDCNKIRIPVPVFYWLVWLLKDIVPDRVKNRWYD